MDYKQQIWEHHHYRFGLAGQGQADLIERYLNLKPGRVLDIGCGPWEHHVRNLALHSKLLIAADISLGRRLIANALANVCLLAVDARALCLAEAVPSFAGASDDDARPGGGPPGLTFS